MKLLITGANGQVGSALISKAKQDQINYIAFTKNILDITDEAAVFDALKIHQPTVLINAAAYTDVEQAESFSDLAHKINAVATDRLAKACKFYDIPFLHISTDYVFSGKRSTPYVETDVVDPLNQYGASKLAGENAALNTHQKCIILRTSWVFSATGKNFVKTMWRLFHEREEVRVVNDQYGGPTSAEAIASTLIAIAKKVSNPLFDAWGIYHFSGSPVISWYDFACAIRDASHDSTITLIRLLPISSCEFPSKVLRPMYSGLNGEKLERVFNIPPCDWKEDLIKVIKRLGGK